MEHRSGRRKNLMVTAWVCAGILLLVLGLVAALELGAAGRQQAQEEARTPVPEVQPSETENTELPVSESTLPILDLPENPYTPEDFTYAGLYQTLESGACLLGIDVSAWQETIDWPQVKGAGMDFAMIRMAWRGSSEGGIFADNRAEENYYGAKKAGMKVGGYFFSQAITPEEAVEEAEFFLDMIKDWELEMPIVYDWEFAGGPRTDGMDDEAITACALAFCQTIEAAGYDAMVYFNPRMAYYEINLEVLKEYGLWLAMWDTEMTFPYKVDMWQYTDQGSVPGIETNVDMNIYFLYE